MTSPPDLPPEYFETVFVVDSGGARSLGTFAIITAWNPMDAIASPAENAEADTLLQAEIERRKFPCLRATGASPDFSHREPGWAIQCALDQALDLAKTFEQRAFWWIEDRQLMLVRCGDARSWDLGLFEARLVESPAG